MEKSKYQKFIVETISRNDIKNADYNPRIMSKEAKKRLKENLKSHGLASALTWNRRTGNLVGGHQRLEQLDSLEKNKNYSLDVCVIDVDEYEEIKLNTLLNNSSMQGDWDTDKLIEIRNDYGTDFSEMGFTELDVNFMFDGDNRFTDLFETEETETVKSGLENVKEARKNSAERLEAKNNINWYSIIVFKDEEQKKEFYKQINMPVYEEYLTVESLMRLKDD